MSLGPGVSAAACPAAPHAALVAAPSQAERGCEAGSRGRPGGARCERSQPRRVRERPQRSGGWERGLPGGALRCQRRNGGFPAKKRAEGPGE